MENNSSVLTDAVCDNVEIGRRLEGARKDASITDESLAAFLKLSVETLGNYKRAVREWGARDLARAAMRCGMTPNEVLLVDPKQQMTSLQLAEFDAIDRGHILRFLNDLRFLNSLGFKVRATEIAAGGIHDVAVRFRESMKAEGVTALPIGSTVEQDGDAKVLTPPEARQSQRRMNAGTAKVVSEQQAKYGKRKAQ